MELTFPYGPARLVGEFRISAVGPEEDELVRDNRV